MSTPSSGSQGSSSSSSSSALSASDFGPSFDLRVWINQQLEQGAAADANSTDGNAGSGSGGVSELGASTARLSSLLMRLQLLAADVNTTMEAQSQQLVHAMPKAMREIAFINRESQSLRVNLTDILKDMSKMDEHSKQPAAAVAPIAAAPTSPAVPGSATSPGLTSPPGQSSLLGGTHGTAAPTASVASATSTIEFLQSIDVVKGRIVRCAHTLEEIEQWKQKEALIDKMFDNIQMQTGAHSGGGAGTAGDDGAGTAAPALVSASSYGDLSRIHRELSSMQSIVERFRTMGLGQEHEARVASLHAYQARLAQLTELCLDQTMELLQASSVPAVTTDGVAISAAGADSGSDSSLVSHLQVLHQIYSSLGKLATFEAKYRSQKIKPALAKQVLGRYSSGQKPAAATAATAAATSATGVDGKAAASPAKASSTSSQLDVKQLSTWLPLFCNDVVHFTIGELRFAQQVFGESNACSSAKTAASASASERDASMTHAVSHSTAATDVPVSSAAFVYSALLESLHDELVPLLTLWFSGYMAAHKSSEGAQLVLQLWQLSVDKLGWPLANIFFPPPPPPPPPANAPAAHGGAHNSHVTPARPLLQPLQTVQGSTGSLGIRLPHWSDEQLQAQHSLLVDILYQPFVRYVEDYGLLEKKKLFSSLDEMSFGGEGYEQTANNIAECHKLIVAASASARDRCLQLSGGVLTEPLLSSLQEYYTEYIQRMFSLLRRLRRIAGLDGGGMASPKSRALPSPTGAGAGAGAGEELGGAGSQSASAAAAAASAVAATELSNADAQWSNFQGCFLLLRVCRSMQWELFAPHAEEAFVEQMCGQGLVALLRACEEEREKVVGAGTGADALALPKSKPSSSQAQSQALQLQAARRNSIPGTPNSATSAAAGAPSTQAAAAAPASSSSFKSPADVTRMIFVTFLLRHADRLKGLHSFLHKYFLPAHPHLLQSLLTPQQQADAGHHTQGLHTHPSTPMMSPAASAAAGGAGAGAASAAAANARLKLGFPASSPSHGGGSGGVSAHPSHLFASSAALFDSFISALHNLIYDTMFKSIAARLAPLHEWSHIWSAKSGAGMLSAIPLPSFSMQPSDYMIQIGEHLLTLVQQLEPFVRGGDDDEEEQDESGHESTGDNSGAGSGRKLSIPVSPFSGGGSGTPSSPPFPASAPSPPAYVESDALYWLGLLSRGTFKALLSSVHQLALLSDRGATQLATDLEYLVNVLSALGLQMPPLILKLALWLQWSEATMQTKLAELSAGEWRLDELQPEDKQMLRHVIHCRRFKGIETDARIQAKLNQ